MTALAYNAWWIAHTALTVLAIIGLNLIVWGVIGIIKARVK